MVVRLVVHLGCYLAARLEHQSEQLRAVQTDMTKVEPKVEKKEHKWAVQ